MVIRLRHNNNKCVIYNNILYYLEVLLLRVIEAWLLSEILITERKTNE